jgi:hypothetical protein
MTFKQTFSLIGPLVSSILRTRLAESMASPVIKRTLLGSLASTTMLSSGLVFGAAGDAVFYKVDGSGTNVIDITCTNNRFYDLPPCFFEIKVEIFDPDGLSNFSPDTDGGTSYLPSAPQDSFASFQNAAPITGLGNTHTEVTIKVAYPNSVGNEQISLNFQDDVGNDESLTINWTLEEVSINETPTSFYLEDGSLSELTLVELDPSSPQEFTVQLYDPDGLTLDLFKYGVVYFVGSESGTPPLGLVNINSVEAIEVTIQVVFISNDGNASVFFEQDGSGTSIAERSATYEAQVFVVEIYDADGIDTTSFINPPSVSAQYSAASIDAIDALAGFGSTHAQLTITYDATSAYAASDSIRLQFKDELGNDESLTINVSLGGVDTSTALAIPSFSANTLATAEDVNAALFTVARYATKLEEQVIALENELSTLEASKADLISSIEAEEASVQSVDEIITPFEDTTPISTLADLVGRTYCFRATEYLLGGDAGGNMHIKIAASSINWTIDSETEATITVFSQYVNSEGNDHYAVDFNANQGVFSSAWSAFKPFENVEGQTYKGTPQLLGGRYLVVTGDHPYFIGANAGMYISSDGKYLMRQVVEDIPREDNPDLPYIVGNRLWGAQCEGYEL